MNAYRTLSQVYDELMSADLDYDHYLQYIQKLINRYSVKKVTSICDLGCGTGSIAIRLAKQGYEVIGIDLSEEMLMEAHKKAEAEALDILFIHQDLTEFELYGTVDACIATIDVLNYIVDEEELLKVFRLVNNYLEPQGVFVFDMNTRYKFSEVLGNDTFTFQNQHLAYIWENEFDAETDLNYYDISFFVEQDNGLYERIEEEHIERAYSINMIVMLLKQSGMELIDVYEYMTEENPTETSTRIVFVAREKGKSHGLLN